jgi:hypothetical protein
MGNGRSRADIGPLMYRRASGRKGRQAEYRGELASGGFTANSCHS